MSDNDQLFLDAMKHLQRITELLEGRIKYLESRIAALEARQT